jgi:FkbM family methyltransferase
LKWLANHPVTQRYPFRTWSRWTYWQNRQRFTLRPQVISFANGTRLAVYPHEGLTGYWYVEFPDYEEMIFLRCFLRAGDVFYDVGANAGAFAIFAAGLGCQVVAFEPVPHSYQRLRENVALNVAACSITPLNQAVGASAGELRMTTSFGTGNHVLPPGESSPSVEVKMVTLDEIIREQPIPTFIKVDVEGHELEVLKGASTLLGLPMLQGLLLETFRPHNWQQPKLQALEKLLQAKGFKPFAYHPESNRIVPLDRPDDGDNNTFYFRSSEQVQSRLKRDATSDKV